MRGSIFFSAAALACLLGVQTAAAEPIAADGVVAPPSRAHDGKMVAPAPNGERLDPGIERPAPPTEGLAPRQSGDGGSVVSRCYGKDNKAIGAVTKRQCDDANGSWHDTQTPSAHRTKTADAPF